MSKNTSVSTQCQLVSDDLRNSFDFDAEGYNWFDVVPTGMKSPLKKFEELDLNGKPAVLELQHRDAFLFAIDGSYDPKHSSLNDFDTIVEHVAQQEQKQQDRNNPHLPRWRGQTDSRLTTWRFDFGAGARASLQQKIDEELNLINPAEIGTAPIGDINTLGIILEPIVRNVNCLARRIGTTSSIDEDEERWRQADAVASLASFGKAAFRVLAETLAQNSGSEIWARYTVMSDSELDQLFIDAWRQSGRALTSLWLDFPWFSNLLRQEENAKALARIPFLYKQLEILHLFKYVRLCYNKNGDAFLFVCYRDRYQYVPVPPSGMNQSLAQQVNQHVASALDVVLRIDRGVGSKTRTRLQNEARAIYKEIRPADFSERLDLAVQPEILVGSAVCLQRAQTSTGWAWLDVGVVVTDFARVDMETGVVDTNAKASGAEVLTYAWPTAKFDSRNHLSFLSQLPKLVLPELPHVNYRKYIRNLADHGHTLAVNALIDGWAIGGLLRKDLAGTDLGNILESEYPLVAFLADDNSDRDNVTNTGKTLGAKNLGAVCTPSIKVMSSSCCAPGPAQRELVSGIRQDGCGVLDEYRVPPAGKNNFADPSCLQTMTVGGLYAAGIALGNGEGLRLLQSLMITAKYLRAPKDIYNRTLPFFSAPLTKETRNTEDELTMLAIGTVSKLVRISALLYIKKYDLVNILGRLKPVSSEVWRFFGHATLATFFASGDVSAVQAYLKFAIEHCKRQCEIAHDMGLDEEIGDTEIGFDILWFLDNAADEVMYQAALWSLDESRIVTPTEFLESVVRNSPHHMSGRNVDRIIRNVASCVKKFSNFMKDHENKFEHPLGYIVELVPKKLSKKTINGHEVAFIRVTHPTVKVEPPKVSDNILKMAATTPASPVIAESRA